MVSSTSATDSFSLAGTDLDTELSSTLQGLSLGNPALGSYLGAWVSTDDLVDYHGADALGPFIPATGLVVRAGEDPEAWVLTDAPGVTSSQTMVDLESSSWVLLNDLVCDLTEDAFVSTQSILVYQPDGSSNAVVYVSLTDLDSTLSGLRLDRTPDFFLYTDIVEVSSALGLGPGSGFDAATPPSDLTSDSYLNGSTQAGSEAELLAPCGELGPGTGITTGGTSDLLLTSTTSSLDSTSSLDLSTNLADNSLDSSVDVDVASNPEFSDPSGLGVSGCPCVGSGN